ncbi:MAG: hypothetical protein IPM06_19815 [Rhizobiales bacterium]|nr:hypothetical protein [Hyphomicrobiales bacterium]
MIAVYPTIDGDALTQTRLLGAWVRRKRFEARLVALEVAKMFSGTADPERVSEEQMWAEMGIKPVIYDGS